MGTWNLSASADSFPRTIHPYIADVTGNFSEALLDEMGFERHATFTERARTVHAGLRADLDHRHYSGIEVLRELARRDPRGRPDAVHVQRVSDVVIVPEPFGGGNGMLTSQFKLRHRRIAEAYLKGTALSGS
jgi:hypothetical protein